MIFRVLLERHEAHEAHVEVEAETMREAEELARSRAHDGMIAWTRVNEDTRAQVEPR